MTLNKKVLGVMFGTLLATAGFSSSLTAACHETEIGTMCCTSSTTEGVLCEFQG